MIKLDGADTSLLHIAKKEETDKLKIGAKVTAIWKEEPSDDIFSLDSFKVV
ncbi:TPA: DNA-binding protein, partial [Candidatus Bipolaricaulota bacterium]|nr:DNA-binding protein [Candidatus Bipolaricaulota bacterium]